MRRFAAIPPRPQAATEPRKPANRPLSLEPESGVVTVDGAFHAVSLPIWLRIEPIRLLKRHAWITLRYSSGVFDDAVRPLIKFITNNGKELIQPMNAPVLGTAEWIGRIPNRTVSVSISPSNRLGPFSFQVENIDALTRRELIRTGLRTDPPWALWSLRSRLLNSREEAWQALKYARGGTRLDRYDEWRARFARPVDLAGFDRPRSDWGAAPRFYLLMSLDTADADGLRNTIASLRAQFYQRWSLCVRTNERVSPTIMDALRDQMRDDKRVIELSQVGKLSEALHDNDRIAVIQCGDTIENYGLAAIVELIAQQPRLALIYSDEDSITQDGTFHSPVLKPDWSPIFYRSFAYLGGLTCVRHDVLRSSGAGLNDMLSEEGKVRDRIMADIDAAAVGHMRRILYHNRDGKRELSFGLPAIRVRAQTEAGETIEWPKVTIVMPTRDHAELLVDATRGLQESTDYPCFDVVVVDNGSVDVAARAVLERLKNDTRFKILERPYPFNYSRLCNDGAAASDSPVLVFLNNDVQIFSTGWLKAMVRLATKPQIGVVGAKLMFPNGRIQHAGVVLGMGGIAGHVYRRGRPQEPGYLNQLTSVREISAVTAACIAVERAKFEAVGKFDAENLPIDLNDIDLCLRIREAGWTNVWTPDAVLIHAQSGSRGQERDPFLIYQRERSYFVRRWAESIRDDPCFHPGLSLFSQRPALS